MGTATTHRIQVTAIGRYEAAQSDPGSGRFLFSYRITITNQRAVAVQLLRRHWTIRDSLAGVREVEGAGVVGDTPVIAPGGSYSYTSSCELRSGLGRMDGTYLMVTLPDEAPLSVVIPTLHLRWPGLSN